uniref:Uncharacterized protein n=1 Tax=Hanusia phi TaxID=3032 RepID=A0A7S0NFP6_9CRYP|mmetsp:Transcript_9160/g.21009  ORF Transcript_9160/g.21009 Transcript_9160/m.21009 type:complete len:449 (+) Transcript_9160:166-1512(+)
MLGAKLSPCSLILISTLFIGSTYDCVQGHVGHADSCVGRAMLGEQGRFLAFSWCQRGFKFSLGDHSKQLTPLSRNRPTTVLHVHAGMKDWIKKVVFGDETKSRWKRAVTQYQVVGTGATEEEKLEAARIRRRAFVVQDPKYREMIKTEASFSAEGVSMSQESDQETVVKGTEGSDLSSVQKEVKLEVKAQEAESDLEAEARKQRSLELQQDAARTLGGRSKYFTMTTPSRPLNQHSSPRPPSGSQDAWRPKSSVLPTSSNVANRPSVTESVEEIEIEPEAPRNVVSYKNLWKEAATKKLANILSQKHVTIETKRQTPPDEPTFESSYTSRSGDSSDQYSYLPVLGEDFKPDLECSTWKVIAAKGVVVHSGPGEEFEPIGRLKGMQLVDVDGQDGPWLRLSESGPGAGGWVRSANNGRKGGPKGVFLVKQGKKLGFDSKHMARWSGDKK